MPVDKMMQAKMNELASEEKSLARMTAPEMDFSPGTAKQAIKAISKLIDLFPGAEEPELEDLPSYLELMVTSIGDAVDAGALPEELRCEMPVTDADLKYTIGKLGVLAKPTNKRAFAKFLEGAGPMSADVEPQEAPVEEDPLMAAIMAQK